MQSVMVVLYCLYMDNDMYDFFGFKYTELLLYKSSPRWQTLCLKIYFQYMITGLVCIRTFFELTYIFLSVQSLTYWGQKRKSNFHHNLTCKVLSIFVTKCNMCNKTLKGSTRVRNFVTLSP